MDGRDSDVRSDRAEEEEMIPLRKRRQDASRRSSSKHSLFSHTLLSAITPFTAMRFRFTAASGNRLPDFSNTRHFFVTFLLT
jgi:hypothetical protein